MTKADALKACQELLKDLAAADMSRADYIEVLDELSSDAETASEAAKEDEEREDRLMEEDDDDEEDEDEDDE